MDNKEFRKWGHEFVDWMADYLDSIEEFPVKSPVKPGDILSKLPISAPEKAESMADIFDDFKSIILPGMTHWQHPSFHAYFPGNSSKPSVLAEMLTATMGAQCMIWASSPAAAELEEQMMTWLKKILHLPDSWAGSIQNGASDATLNAILSARERASSFTTNKEGLSHNLFRVYCSEQAHSSIDKGVAIAGIGRNNLVKVPVDEHFAMDVMALEKCITTDREDGKIPLIIIGALGTTGSTAIDPLLRMAEVSQKENLWFHVDAALAGTALMLEEMQWMAEGIDQADSFVFNPHKWMFTNFDCSAYFVKDKKALINTFAINPEYLKTSQDENVSNYRDWGIPLGRRFRALKLWFVIRSYGVSGLKEKVRKHLELASWFEKKVKDHDQFELLAPVPLNTICFRYLPTQIPKENINAFNEQLLERVNSSGKLFITHTLLNGNYTLRMVIGQTAVERHHVEMAWQVIADKANELEKML